MGTIIYSNNQNFIAHHGILGQKWGIRRYQPYPKGYTGSGKEIGEAKRSAPKQPSKRQQKKMAKQDEKERAAKLEEARKQKEIKDAAEKKASEKEKVLRSGSATDILKYKGELTNNELQTAVTRLRLEQDIAKYSISETRKNMDKMDSIMKDLGTVTNWVETGTRTYNALAKIYNATEEGKKKPWTLVGESNKKKKKD